MSTKELLQKYNSRLAKEGWIRSMLCGLSIGFSLNIICSVLFLIFGIKAFWISIIVFAVGAAIATPIFYYAKFRKSTRQVAARVDTLGLEERILTMAQYENDDSYIARRQREDAENALKSVDNNCIKIAISIPLVIICVITMLIGIGCTTASALTDKSVIDTIKDNIAEKENPPIYFDIEYSVENDEGGYIEGEIFQSILSGENATAVQAIAEDDYVFVGWSDGNEDPYRTDLAITENMILVAHFEPIEYSEDGEPSEEDGPGKEGDPMPGDPTSPSQDPSDQDGGDTAGGASQPANQIVDGNTYYGDEYGESFSQAQNDISSGSDYSEGEEGNINNYFHNIAK